MEIRIGTKVVVGYDLGNLSSQISYCSLTEDAQPETISVTAGAEQFNIPTTISRRKGVNQWFYGQEAEKNAKQGEGTLVRNLLQAAIQGRSIEIEGTEFQGEELLSLFVKKSLSLLFMVCRVQQIESLVITVEELSGRMVELLEIIASDLLVRPEKISFRSREESFFAYMIHQEAALWNHQVVVLDVSEGILKTMCLEMNRRTVPIVFFLEKKEYPDLDVSKMPQTEMAGKNFRAQYDHDVAEIAERLLEERLVSSVYLIGDGFAGEWCTDTIRCCCKGRRVFQGNNMYSKGACYYGKEKLLPSDLGEKHIFLGQDKMKANIGMKLVTNGEEGYYALLDAGQNWFECRKEFEIIMESGNELDFTITPLNGKEIKTARLILDGLPERPKKACRLNILISLHSENLVAVQVKDMGFGDWFPSSGLEWKEEFEVS